jgi:hypothetical protein
MKTNGSHLLYGARQLGPESRYVVGSATVSAFPVIVNGAVGTTCGGATPNFASETIAGSTGTGIWVPSTAVAADVVVSSQFTSADTALVAVAPSGPTTFGQFTTGTANTNPPPLYTIATSPNQLGRILLESTAIWVCSSTASGAVFSYGWKDAVNAN